MSSRRLARPALATVVALIAVVALAPAAHAACPTVPLSQPFLKYWNDFAYYTLVPQGHFEGSMTKWSLSRARTVSGNEPYYLNSSRDVRSLAISPGGSATSPAVCTTALEPVVRFVARSSGTGALKVEAVFQGRLSGKVYYVQIGLVPPMPTWNATPQIAVLANLRPALPEEQLPVAFRLTALDGSNWQVDDVYIDPYRRS